MKTKNVESVAVNAREMSQKNPNSFSHPSKDELNQIKAKDSVKICVGKERFWVEVEKVEDSLITGTIDNNLLQDELEFGQSIQFHKDNIYNIDD